MVSHGASSARSRFCWSCWLPSIPLGGRRWPTWPVAGFLAVTISIFLAFNNRISTAGNVAYGGFIGVVGAGMPVEHFFGKTSQQYRWLVLSFVSLALAFTIWNLDKAGKFGSPESWFQGHAL